ncbi:hypothetical protein [Rhodococcus sp. 05-2255-1e]|uniref:hypothetical protein n=1 Tax=Rhodococcus sp. 05-2255-1e TaxID=2022495 RepID=UPI0015C5F35C|nr:hypothetical protein [Rhodococcus sp. 05-2255-1e]
MNEPRLYEDVTSEASVWVETRMNEILIEKGIRAPGGRAAGWPLRGAAQAAIYTWFYLNHPVVTVDDSDWTDAPLGSELVRLAPTERIESDWDVLAVLRLVFGKDLEATREMARAFYDALLPVMVFMTSAQLRARIETARADAARFASYLDPEDER